MLVPPLPPFAPLLVEPAVVDPPFVDPLFVDPLLPVDALVVVLSPPDPVLVPPAVDLLTVAPDAVPVGGSRTSKRQAPKATICRMK